MIAILTHLATELSAHVTFGSADTDSGPMWLLALGPAAGGVVYFFSYRYYRNTHTSHGFERETRIQAQPVTGGESKVRAITGTKRSRIEGDNRTSHRQRVQRF